MPLGHEQVKHFRVRKLPNTPPTAIGLDKELPPVVNFYVKFFTEKFKGKA